MRSVPCYDLLIFTVTLILLGSGCKKDHELTILTAEVREITSNSAICGGAITDEGSAKIIARGVCWSTDSLPTIVDNKTTDGVGGGSFTSYMADLRDATKYFVRAYATSDLGTNYGMVKSFITPVRTSGIDKINNTIYGSGSYYAFGFSFSQAKKISSLINPGPDVILYLNTTNQAITLTFQTSNFFNSFYKFGEYSDLTSAAQAFKILTSADISQWEAQAIPLKANQIWIFRTSISHYAKLRITEIQIGGTYAECTFEWVYQPDGTLTFPNN